MTVADYYKYRLRTPFDGSNGSTVFPDYSLYNVRWIATGGAALSNTWTGGGTATLHIPRGDKVTCKDLDFGNAGSSDFTAECWCVGINAGAGTATRHLMGVWSADPARWWHFGVGLTTGAFYEAIIGGVYYNKGVAGTFVEGIPQHLCLERFGNKLTLYVNGVINQQETTVSGSMPTPGTGGEFTFGSNAANQHGEWYVWNASFVLKAKYGAANFTPDASNAPMDVGQLPLTYNNFSHSNNAHMFSNVNVYSPIKYVNIGFHKGPIRDFSYDYGDGIIAGEVDTYSTPTNTPVSRLVRLHRKSDGKVIRDVWSGADGKYAFKNIRRDDKYYVVGFDYTLNFNGVIKDNITAEQMT